MSRRHDRRAGVRSGLPVAVLSFVLVLTFAPASPAQTAPPNAPADALPEGYVGAATCKMCHEDAFTRFGATRMGRLFLKHPRDPRERLGCETCHGPGKQHVEAGGGKGTGIIAFTKGDTTPIEQRNALCLRCHTKGARMFWKGSPHDSRSVACTSCHRIMDRVSPRSQLAKVSEIDTCGQCHQQRKAQTMRSSHMPLREGKMTCTACHNPHGTVTPALLRESSTNDTCYTCHAEKRGPFLWQHAPVTENCATCHDPHGSNHERMLRTAKPRLCQGCHDPTGHPARPFGLDTDSLKFVLGRSCTSCHVNVHGSNHPSGFAFER